MEGEFTDGMRQIFARIGLAGPAMEKILGTQKNASPRSEPPVYTPELAARTFRLYQRDFNAFGYDEDSWRGL
jgi:hypothetical protein